EEEAFTLLTDPDEPFYNEQFISLIKPNIQRAQKLTLTDNYQSGIIDAFIT